MNANAGSVSNRNEVETAVDGRSANAHGGVSLGLSAVGLVSAPFLLWIPVVGFLPGLLAGRGGVVAWRGLAGDQRRSPILVAGLIAALGLFALLGALASVWYVMVAGPAMADYPELREALIEARRRILGF
ncbi:MAG: hypothetical protein L0G99_00915 [Propionibacteriales bacterium]|nr:hypothetical protein [Propionibacteriales bacterium]